MSSVFLVNARSGTLGDDFLTGSRCRGYLFPPDAQTRALVTAFQQAPRRWIVSDNGVFDEIGRISRLSGGVGRGGSKRYMEVLRARADVVNSSAQVALQ